MKQFRIGAISSPFAVAIHHFEGHSCNGGIHQLCSGEKQRPAIPILHAAKHVDEMQALTAGSRRYRGPLIFLIPFLIFAFLGGVVYKKVIQCTEVILDIFIHYHN